MSIRSSSRARQVKHPWIPTVTSTQIDAIAVFNNNLSPLRSYTGVSSFNVLSDMLHSRHYI